MRSRSASISLPPGSTRTVIGRLSSVVARLASLHDHGRSDVVMLLRRKSGSHQGYHAVREQRVLGRLVDARWAVPTDPHIHEPCSPELVGEDTLRQGTSHSPCPGALIVGDLWRELPLDGEIGEGDPAPRNQDAIDL